MESDDPTDRRFLCDTPITVLRLPLRALCALSQGGFKNLDQLVRAPAYDLLCLPDFGRKSLSRLQDELAEHGLVLAGRMTFKMKQAYYHVHPKPRY